MTAGSPLVSIVVAARNASATIRHCIASVLSQDIADLEIVVCDDASTDATPEILYGVDDPRLRVLRNDANLGAGPSRDRAIASAKGELVALIDADDAWLPNRLRSLLWAHSGDARELVFDDLLLCHDAGERMIPFKRVHGTRGFGAAGRIADVATATYLSNRRLVASPLCRRELIVKCGAAHGTRRSGQDLDFRIALLASGARLRYLPEALYLYRLRPGSLSANPTGPAYIQIFEDAKRQFEGDPVVYQALERKIKRLRNKHELATMVRQPSLAGAVKLAVRHPTAARDLLRNAMEFVGYEASRRWHGVSQAKMQLGSNYRS